MMTTDTEISLIRRAKTGETEAFGQLYDTYVKRIYDFIYYKTMHQQTAEDLTSDTFFKALRSINQFKDETGSFQAWLYRIARNTVIDHYRAKKTTVAIDDIWGLGSTADVEIDVDNKVLLEKIQSHLATLTTEQRDIVILRVWEGLSYKEIAAIVEKSPEACKVSFSRTVSKLRAGHLTGLLLLLNQLVT